ncbi:MAG: JAB domain-containing protein [Candidatus Rokuibacteriota bacterium]
MTPYLFPSEPAPDWNFVRLVREPGTRTRQPATIHGPSDVRRLLIERVRQLDQEAFYVVCLDVKSQVRAVHEVSRGTLNGSLVHPREVFRAAILAGSAGIILAHNHPSGDPTPSADDRAVTRQMVDAGRLLDVPCHDHVILAGERYLSFAEAGLL